MRTRLRTHTCGELRAEHAGMSVSLCGWVHHSRDVGGILFLVLRDHYGSTQVAFEPEEEPAPVQVIEILPEREAAPLEPKVDEVAPILRAEAESMKTEAGIGLRPSQSQAEEWEVPTYLRKQND